MQCLEVLIRLALKKLISQTTKTKRFMPNQRTSNHGHNSATLSKLTRQRQEQKLHIPGIPFCQINNQTKNHGPSSVHLKHLVQLLNIPRGFQTPPSHRHHRPRLHRADQPLVPRQPQQETTAQTRRDANGGTLAGVPRCEEGCWEGEEEVWGVWGFGQGGE
jgi:hypothetical protein